MDLEKVWKAVLAEVELSVSKPTFHTHFAQTRLVSFNQNVATVGCNSPLMATLIETKYYSLIKSILDTHAKGNTSLVFAVLPKKLSPKEAGPLFSQTTLSSSPDAVALAKSLRINPNSTFENFAVSTTNQLAYAAATAVAKTPGGAYNPLIIYGGVGVGKTHLMHAVANRLLSKKPGMRVVCSMGEEFLNEIVAAIQTKSTQQFKRRYRSAQLLLIDDVQFIAGKQTAQEEFFHTFNVVVREGGQIILTSDRPPGEIEKLEDRLRSRFEGGLSVDISPPDFELRAAIVNIKAATLGLTIPADAGQLIAANITDTRAIEGVLRRLATEVAARGVTITPEVVSSVLRIKEGPVVQKMSPSQRVSPQLLLDAVSSAFGVKQTSLKGPKRDRPIARPRQVFMYLARVELGLTHKDIGGFLGGRDHTTVMHGVETITRELSTNNSLRVGVEGIKNILFHLSTK